MLPESSTLSIGDLMSTPVDFLGLLGLRKWWHIDRKAQK
jgi:hypothetical protein